MLAGLMIGDLIFLSFAVFGLAVVAHSFSALFVVIRWFSIFYLLWLAWSFWNARHHDLSAKEPSKKDLASACLSGVLVTLSNPKTIAFYLALVPLVLDLESIGFQTWATILIPVTLFVLLIVGGAFILAALSVRRLLSSARAQNILHKVAATTMGAAGISMIMREF